MNRRNFLRSAIVALVAAPTIIKTALGSPAPKVAQPLPISKRTRAQHIDEIIRLLSSAKFWHDPITRELRFEFQKKA